MADVVLPAGCHLIALDRIGSTNDEAKGRAAEGAPDGTVIWAREQTAGRGRRGREWSSPVGNLYLSILLRPARPAHEAAQLSLVAAVALGDAIAASLPSGVSVACKWPNDILVDGCKTAGILLESSGAQGDGSVEWVVVGCGVNVVSHPDTALYPATDLNAAGGVNVTMESLLERFLTAFFAWRDTWRDSGIGPVRGAWLARAAGLGGNVTVRLPNREMTGRFAAMDETGSLVLELPDGSRETIAAGDVFL
jgi:BirA family biotin operon repressor/biotin-[acetyl-CoA-carboxylase] ligase